VMIDMDVLAPRFSGGGGAAGGGGGGGGVSSVSFSRHAKLYLLLFSFLVQLPGRYMS